MLSLREGVLFRVEVRRRDEADDLSLLLAAASSAAVTSSSSAGDDFRFLSECVFLLSELADAVVPSEVATAEAEAFRGEVVLSDEDFLCISLVAVASFAFFTNS